MSDLNTLDEAIEILQAMKEGKEIEVEIGGTWYPSSVDLPAFDGCKYRIKPRKPREIWVNVYSSDYLAAYSDEGRAKEAAWPSAETLLFREVIEEE